MTLYPLERRIWNEKFREGFNYYKRRYRLNQNYFDSLRSYKNAEVQISNSNFGDFYNYFTLYNIENWW